MNTLTQQSTRHSAINIPSKKNSFQLVDMKYITELTGMTDKWFYSLIKNGVFPKPIKLGRSSRWKQIDIEMWIEDRMKNN